MERKWGIDVSYHNGNIDWKAVKDSGIQFAILRAGYSYTIDNKFTENARGCYNNGIPFGAYWFSYALNPEAARKEAKCCLGVLSKWKLDYPVCFDFEYDSLDYAKKHGVNLSSKEMVSIAEAFLTEVEKEGYYAMNYSNPDFLGKGFGELTNRFDLWLARWGSLTEPGYNCGIWQYSSVGSIPGINGAVDLNVAYNDYPKIINVNKEENAKENKKKKELKLLNEIKEKINELESLVGE